MVWALCSPFPRACTRGSFTGSRTRPEGLVVDVDMVAGDHRLGSGAGAGGRHVGAGRVHGRHGEAASAAAALRFIILHLA